MSLYRRTNSSLWWTRFTLGGREIRRSTGTADKALAEEFEHELRRRHWREIRLGERFYTFGEAGARWKRDRAGKRSLERDERILAQYQDLDTLPLRDFSRDMLDELRQAREKVVSRSTVNREFALLRAIFNAAVGEWRWLESAPKFPMAVTELADARWITREQFRTLLEHLPEHLRAMAKFAVATGLRRGNITGLTWDRVDLVTQVAYIPGSGAKGKRGISVPLNADAIAVLKSRLGDHDTHVFVFRGAPVYQVTTRAWREACSAAGLKGLRFHDLRHTWASWQAQSGTDPLVLQHLGGWASQAMVLRYAHLSPRHLQAYARRTLLGTPAKKRRARHK
jgi:integrase